MTPEYIKALDEMQKRRLQIHCETSQDNIQRLVGEILGILHYVDYQRFEEKMKEEKK